MTTAELYEVDFAEWAVSNAQLLRCGRVGEADLENIAEEIEALARRDRRAVRRRAARLVEYLLKWQFQPGRRSGSWERTILEQREYIKGILEDSPSLRRGLEDEVNRVYALAKRFASKETRTADLRFPESCPYSLEQVLDHEFLPEGIMTL